jgi:hypothetical protein
MNRILSGRIGKSVSNLPHVQVSWRDLGEVKGRFGNTVGTPTFGVVSSTSNTPRQLQFALKLQF